MKVNKLLFVFMIEGSLTVNKPNYFNVWMIDWSKSKRPGHGQETQPQP